MSLGVIRLGFHELPVRVSPASGEHDTRAFAGAGFVSFQGVANDCADILADQRLESLGSFVCANAVTNDAGRRDAPHLPRLILLPVEASPAGLIEPDHGLRERVLEQRRIRELKFSSQSVELIPQRLRRHFEPVPAKDALLPRERQVIEVLVGTDLDREVERVAAALDRALRPGRGLDGATAATRVLALLDLDEAVADVDEIDHLGLFELSLHRAERAAATRTDAVGLVELEHSIFYWQLELLGGTKLFPLFAGLFLRFEGRGRDRSCSLLLLPGQGLDQRQRLLQFGRVALECLKLLALGAQHAQQLLDLDLLRDRDAAQVLDVLLAPQVHAFSRSYGAIESKNFRLDDAG